MCVQSNDDKFRITDLPVARGHFAHAPSNARPVDMCVFVGFIIGLSVRMVAGEGEFDS